MASRKEVYKVGTMTEDNRNLIAGLLALFLSFLGVKFTDNCWFYD